MFYLIGLLLLACGPKTRPPDLISFDVPNSAIPSALASDDAELRSIAYGGLTATASQEEIDIWWPKITAEPDAYFRQRGIDALFATNRFLDKVEALSSRDDITLSERCLLMYRLHRNGRDQSPFLPPAKPSTMSERLNCALAFAAVNGDSSELSVLLSDATLVTDLPFYWALQTSGLSLPTAMRTGYDMAEDSYRMSLLGAWLALHPDDAYSTLKSDGAALETDDRMELIDFLWRGKQRTHLPAIRYLSSFEDRSGLYARLLLFAMSGEREKLAKETLKSHRDWEMRALAAEALAYRLSTLESGRTLLLEALRSALSEKDHRALGLIIRACGESDVYELAPDIASLGKGASLPIQLEIETALRYFVYNRRHLKETGHE